MTQGLSLHDSDILRRLAERKAAAAQDPRNLERREQWLRHDDPAATGRPMVLAEVGGVLNEVLPDSSLQCVDPWARSLERGLRVELYEFETLGDDHVVDPYVDVNWHLTVSDYGVQTVQHKADNEGRLGARRWDPPITNLSEAPSRLHPRRYQVNREATLASKARLESVFEGILQVRIRGGFWWTLGMTIQVIDLIGLENLMLYMYDEPDGLHWIMKFLRDDHLAFARWLEREGLLSLNNENDYIGSGSMGYTRQLPVEGYKPCGPVRLEDLWVLLESQETVGVGPDQFEEFIFPYQSSLAEHFGRCYYGCCEPVHTRWSVLKRMPGISRVSVSPWADEATMAEHLGRDIVYSRKPNPSLISTGTFDESAIRADLKKTLTTARHCRVELIMKDVHTLNGEPERLKRWVGLAYRCIDEAWNR